MAVGQHTLLAVRPYKTAFDLSHTLRILEDESASHFAPGMLKLFLPLAAALADQVLGRSEVELQAQLAQRRQEVFGV